jgi:ribosomal protein L31E
LTLTAKQQEALDAFAAHGSKKGAARALGIDEKTLRKHLQAAERKLDPAIQDSMNAAGTKLIPTEVWAKTKSEDGISYSVRLRPHESDLADLATRIREAFEGMEPAPPVAPPERVMDDLCTVWPLYDVHWGMHAWGEETGGHDYDLKLAEQDLIGAFERVLAYTPFVAHSVILIGGDFFHADDNTAQTPAHRHNLDVDSRIHKTIKTAIRALKYVIQRVQSKSAHVTIRVLRGNHDEHSHLPLLFALAERFQAGNISVLEDPRDLFMFQWGRTAIFAHHGDKMTPNDFVLRLADQCPFWSETRHRYAYTGHRHKGAAQRIGGVWWEQLDAFAPPDAYGSTWTGRRAFKAEVFDRKSGRVISAHDPLERENQ